MGEGDKEMRQLQWQVTSGKWLVFVFLLLLSTIHYPLSTAFADCFPMWRGTTLFTFGDSITESIQASDDAHKYPSIIANEAGWQLTNLATGGEITPKSNDNIFGTNIANKTNVIWMPGLNDLRWYGLNQGAISTFKDLVLSGLVWLSIPEADKIESDEPGWTFEGNWTQLRIYTANLGTAYATQPGEKASITVEGDVIYLGYINRYWYSDCTLFEVRIDGISQGNVDPCTITVPSFAPKFLVMVKRYSGLTNDDHLVEVIHTGEAGKLTHISFIATNGKVNVNYPNVFLGSAIRMTSTGYGYGGGTNWNQGSDEAVAVWNDAAREVAETLIVDGLKIKAVDSSSVYIPTEHVGADDIHPSDLGYQIIAEKFIEEIKNYTCYQLRQACCCLESP